jgi:hypothetical protein
MSTDHDQVLARFKATWTQIAAAFRNEPGKLVFESINEPQFDNADDARKAALLQELNKSFHSVVRSSGGNNDNRLLMLPTEVCTPDQRLLDNLAGTIQSLGDRRLIATVHYYGYWPFSVSTAGVTRFDAAVREDLTKTFDRVRDTFAARGIPVVVGEYGLLGYDHGPGAVERGEMLKYFEAFGHAARTRKVTTVLWDNGSFFDRGKLRWKDAGLFRQIRSSWTTRSATASSDNFVPRSGPGPYAHPEPERHRLQGPQARHDRAGQGQGLRPLRQQAVAEGGHPHPARRRPFPRRQRHTPGRVLPRRALADPGDHPRDAGAAEHHRHARLVPRPHPVPW